MWVIYAMKCGCNLPKLDDLYNPFLDEIECNTYSSQNEWFLLSKIRWNVVVMLMYLNSSKNGLYKSSTFGSVHSIFVTI